MLDLPQLREGQQVRIIQRLIEGKKERNVPFVGKLLKVRGIGVNKTITVRQNLENIDVDRIFPIASPTIVDVQFIEKKERKIRAKSGVTSRRKRTKKTKK